MILDTWQKEIIDYSGNILLCTGRQVGKTTTLSRKAAIYLLEHPKSRIIIVSLTEDQAKLIIVMMLDYLQKNHKDTIAKGKDKPTLSKVVLKNGASALARPVGNTGDAVRGFTGDVLIIDEGSRMPELAFEAAKPTLLTTAGQIWMCSTPHGKQGYFWQSFQNKTNRFKVWHVSSEKVINDRPLTDEWTADKKEKALEFLMSEKRDMTTMQYGQEYLGLFLEDLRRFFDDEWIKKICTQRRPHTFPMENNYLGVDIARMGNDESSFEILHVPDRAQNKIKQIENITTKKQFTTQTEAKIIELTNTYKCCKVGIDAGSGSLGVGIFDQLRDNPDTKRKVISMNNRTMSMDVHGKTKQRMFKEDLYDNLRSMGEHGEILLLNDDDLITSLRSIQMEFSKDESRKVTKVKIFGNYSHICEGIIRAAWLAKKERIKKFVIDYI